MPTHRGLTEHSPTCWPLAVLTVPKERSSPFDKYCILSRSGCCTEHAEDHNRDGRHRTVLSSTFSSSSIRVSHGGIAAEIRVPVTQRLSLPCLAIDRDHFREVLGHIMERDRCILRQPYRDKTPFVQVSPHTTTVLGARQRNDRPYPLQNQRGSKSASRTTQSGHLQISGNNTESCQPRQSRGNRSGGRRERDLYGTVSMTDSAYCKRKMIGRLKAGGRGIERRGSWV
jgi:hypothetical protein